MLIKPGVKTKYQPNKYAFGIKRPDSDYINFSLVRPQIDAAKRLHQRYIKINKFKYFNLFELQFLDSICLDGTRKERITKKQFAAVNKIISAEPEADKVQRRLKWIEEFDSDKEKIYTESLEIFNSIRNSISAFQNNKAKYFTEKGENDGRSIIMSQHKKFHSLTQLFAASRTPHLSATEEVLYSLSQQSPPTTPVSLTPTEEEYNYLVDYSYVKRTREEMTKPPKFKVGDFVRIKKSMLTDQGTFPYFAGFNVNHYFQHALPGPSGKARRDAKFNRLLFIILDANTEIPRTTFAKGSRYYKLFPLTEEAKTVVGSWGHHISNGNRKWEKKLSNDSAHVYLQERHLTKHKGKC